MKRIASLVALTGIIVIPAVSDAAPKRVERTVTVAYTGACQVGVDGANGGLNGCPNALADSARKGETFVKFSAVDATGQKVGIVSYDPADYGNTATNYCGGSPKAAKIKKGAEIGIKTIVDPTCASVPTQGTLTITFSNQP